MLEQLRKQFAAKMSALDALRVASDEKKAWGPEDQTAYDGLLKEAQALKAQIESAQIQEALKQWQGGSAGSVVKSGFAATNDSGDSYAGFSGEAIHADEGNMPGVFAKAVTVDYDARGRATVSGGELEATTKSGEEKLAALKSGAYKDALVKWMRKGDKALSGNAMKVLQEGFDSAGGAWVPPDMRREIVTKQAVSAPALGDVFSFQTGSDVASFPKVVYTTNDLYTTGVRFSWTAEAPAADISEATNPVSGRVNIPVFTATAAIVVTRALLEDSMFDILGFLSGKLGEAFGLGLDDAIWNGTGIGAPQGILQHTNASVAIASGGMQVLSAASGAIAWGTTATTGVFGVEGALPPQYESGAKWYMNKTTQTALRQLNAGTATLPQWSLGDSYPSLANGYKPSLLGFPVVRDQFLPDISSTTRPIVLGDLKGYYMPQRVGMTVEVLRELRALRDEVVVYARQRVGGQLVEDYRVKVLKSHNS